MARGVLDVHLTLVLVLATNTDTSPNCSVPDEHDILAWSVRRRLEIISLGVSNVGPLDGLLLALIVHEMLSVNVLLVAGALFPVTVSARIDRCASFCSTTSTCRSPGAQAKDRVQIQYRPNSPHYQCDDSTASRQWRLRLQCRHDRHAGRFWHAGLSINAFADAPCVLVDIPSIQYIVHLGMAQ